MIYITGDTHGRLERFSFDDAFRASLKGEENYVIICGDFGAVWTQNKWQTAILDYLSALPFTILFADGNHENFDLLATYPVTPWHGGKVHYIRDNIIHLMRGQIYEIENKSIFVMGGAACHDIQNGILDPAQPDYEARYAELRKANAFFRVKGISWWEQELPSNEELDNAWANICAAGKKLDIIISHCAPTKIQNYIIKRLGNNTYTQNRLTDFLQRVYDNCQFQSWYCGHYHREMTVDKVQVLYRSIVSL